MKILKIENLEIIESINIIYRLERRDFKGSMIVPFKFEELSRAIKEEEQKMRNRRIKDEENT